MSINLRKGVIVEFKVHKYKYYLNAQHCLDYQKERAHAHTFTFTLFFGALSIDGFYKFEVVEDIMKQYFNQFKGKYMNEIPPFDQKSPSIEYIGEVFYEKLKILFLENNFNLIQLEISETPVRVYSISDRLFLGERY